MYVVGVVAGTVPIDDPLRSTSVASAQLLLFVQVTATCVELVHVQPGLVGADKVLAPKIAAVTFVVLVAATPADGTENDAVAGRVAEIAPIVAHTTSSAPSATMARRRLDVCS